MTRHLFACAATGALMIAIASAGPAFAQKSGGILKIQHWDSPASMSIHEEATYSVVVPMMGVMNNLVMFKQDMAQNTLQSIVPDLAESWSWSEDGLELTFNPRQAWYRNLDRVSTTGDRDAVFHLKRPQPAFIALLASGFSPVYPCHVAPAQMRQHPIGTGPFKFVEF